jgi:hemerythrin-like domain-containing protein
VRCRPFGRRLLLRTLVRVVVGAYLLTVTEFDLDTRLGWPEELRFLLVQHPREQWMDHANLGSMARFWLDRHKMFRELGRALNEATRRFREDAVTPQEFQAWFAPRLQFFLQQLNAHHQIEDYHYFPIFRAAEGRLARGFEVLEGDHEVLHTGIVKSVETANNLLRSLTEGGDTMRFTADRYAEVNEQLLRQMLRHLDDEEDLIVPLILARGERELGVA